MTCEWLSLSGATNTGCLGRICQFVLLLSSFFLSRSHLEWDCLLFRWISSYSVDLCQMPLGYPTIRLTCLWISLLTRLSLAVKVLSLELVHSVGEGITWSKECWSRFQLKGLSLESKISECWKRVGLWILNGVFRRRGACFASWVCSFLFNLVAVGTSRCGV